MADSDDPFSRPDATMLRPRPGAGKRGVERARAGRGAGAGRAAMPSRFPSRRARCSASGSIRSCRRRVRCCCSPASCASSLVADGRRRACGATRSRRFAGSRSRRARPACRTRSSWPRATRCAPALDEAVLSTPWGAQSEWAQHPLLVALHREAWGGEKFFEMLDRISQDPARYIDLMELQYLCLAFGFAGKYQVHGARARAARRRPAGPLSQDPQPARAGRRRAVAAVARARGPAQSARFGTCRGGSSARRRWPILAIAFTVYYASLARVAGAGARRAGEGRPRGFLAAAARRRRSRARR